MSKLFFLIITFIFCSTLSAQDKGCYTYLYQKGKAEFAAGHYEAALVKFKGAKNCSDKPATNDLNAQIQATESKLKLASSPKPIEKLVKKVDAPTKPPKKTPAEKPETRPQEAYPQEAIDWEIAMGIGQESAFGNYLSKYPNGLHAATARQRIDFLQQNQKKPPIPTPVVVKKTIFAPEMVEIKGGTFQIGNEKSIYPDEKPVKTLTISRFKMGKYEITQGQWLLVMGSYPTGLPEPYCETCPIRMVSWDAVQVFIQKANQITGKKYRLPTEAEWEFAAKGGAESSNFPYASSDHLSSVGWYTQNAGNTVHAVGAKSASNSGLFDMNGNVAEWCADFYADNYNALTTSNPKGSATGIYRVFRGGSWDDASEYCRNTTRSRETPNYRDERIGFRLAE